MKHKIHGKLIQNINSKHPKQPTQIATYTQQALKTKINPPNKISVQPPQTVKYTQPNKEN